MKYFNIKCLILSIACLSLGLIKAEQKPVNSKVSKEVKSNMNIYKIGFVDYQQLMSLDQKLSNLAVDEWRDGVDRIRDTLKPMDDELSALDKKYTDYAAEMQSMQKSELTSKSAFQRKMQEAADVEQKLRKVYQAREQQLSTELNELKDKVKPKLDTIVTDLRKVEGLDMVLKVQKEAVCAEAEADLTEKVYKVANNKYIEELKLAQKDKSSKKESNLQA